jgi:hypothetical protein
MAERDYARLRATQIGADRLGAIEILMADVVLFAQRRRRPCLEPIEEMRQNVSRNITALKAGR